MKREPELFEKNKLFFGDNLEIMREHINDESVDLIYLDPPFNSKATYNVLFKEKNGSESAAQIHAFEDTWHWDQTSEATYHEIVTECPKKLSDLIQALRSFLGSNDMMAYLTMMAIRLNEMHRILKATGTIYLHCDPTASHYLKLVMDAIFGHKNFRNEIAWCYRGAGYPKKDFGKRHDIILRYSKSNNYIFNLDAVREEYAEATKERFKHYIGNIRNGKDFGTQKLHPLGRQPDDWWQIQPIAPSARARLGYPTQKPEALLDKIIKGSSNENDVVFDPFCGCGTTISVAEHLHRKWIGIDVTHLAITLIKHRLADTFGPELSEYDVMGEPKDLSGAKALKDQDRYQFEWWALGLVHARPAKDKKKGADTGIDGYIYFFDDNSKKPKKIIVQVKSGHVTVSQIRDLKGVLKRERAVIGAFLTLDQPTKPMITEACSAGFYEPANFPGRKFPRIQILTIEELLQGKKIEYQSLRDFTFKEAQRKSKRKDEQEKLFET